MRDTVRKTILVAFTLCVVCSVMVSAFAVGLREVQDRNKAEDMQKNILQAAGIFDPARPVAEQFARFDKKLVDLETGEFVTDGGAVDPESYDPRKAAGTPSLSVEIPAADDLAGIKRREKYAFVYQLMGEGGQVEQYVFPIYGKGLWSTLYGFMAVGPDLDTVKGITFYQHAETPGLGGEVDNPRWKALWPGKEIYGESGDVALAVVKGGGSDPTHDVDGLTGATITARGVGNLVKYWFGDDGFGPFIEKHKAS